ncbi:Thioesterase/thiol ester dehydrase-isomerase [Piromyces finnis]|uniref:Acyl-coenzyme A thioesterase 13 n=1 Tax=Piromyces finnis TaxID=1754191 RepID=A0A1Y1VHP1_9FUNG|nr:Thioesterase/thiol ester dehydrase-isomerase [Piromyces finnis]|eukprot:ORX55904.1 Thioesterase/thiol ester dehydrase-isomerase [Piromyces finnis]
MSLLNITKSNTTSLIKSSSRIILPKCFQLGNSLSLKTPLALQINNFSSTSLSKASTYDYSKHSNETNQLLGYNKVAQLKDSDNKNTLEFVKKAWKEYINGGGFDTLNFKNLEIVEEESNHPGKVTMKFVVQKEQTNRHGGLHGGFISSLIDVVGSLSVTSFGEKYSKHVSADINVSFMRGAKVGDEIFVEARCEKLGRSLAFTVVELYNGKTKNIIAEGRHTKFIK